MLEKCLTSPVPIESLLYAENYNGMTPAGWDSRYIPCHFDPGPDIDNSATPCFTGGFRLRFDSPCIDAGKSVSLWCDSDLDGKSRLVGNAIDIGCYEFQREIAITSDEAETNTLASVPMDYFDNDAKPFLLANNGDYEAAARATAANNINAVWECYVAGISPTNAAETFRTSIALSNGVPCISWQPNLNTNGAVRMYSILGKTNLTDAAWVCPTNAAHRFFKVKVEMP
jgi:hypothetical protein